MMSFSLDHRRAALESAAAGVVDVLVVGGGITGAGVAREAALRGLSVVVLDKGDFASGTSSRSSKLIHGGIRYLEQGDVALVREAARERAVLRRLAPHLARPVKMLVPARSRGGKLKAAAGLWTFEKLAGADDGDAGEILDRRATQAAEPRLRPEKLQGGVAFTEYVTDDARLTLETIQAAALASAHAANYAEVTRLHEDRTGLRAVIEDRVGGGQLEIRARCLVNAAGPWLDRVRGLQRGGERPSLQLTRGIHLVFPIARLPIEHIVVFKAGDGRSTFAVPRDGFVYVGTTDTLYDGPPEEPGVSAADARYLLDALSEAFDDAPTLDDIVGTWAGVRPLVRQEGKKPSEISRRDEIHVGPGPVVSIAGGKLTTYRRMAERVVEQVAGIVGRSLENGGGSSVTALAGGNVEDQRRARGEASKLADPVLDERLWASYGLAAAEIVRRIAADPRLAEPVGGIPYLTRAEVDHAVEGEMVMALDDLLRRRSHVAMFDTQRAIDGAGDVASVLAAHLGWDDVKRERESSCFRTERGGELATVRAEGDAA
jgi:glycerol-3-phosphate dehydrogenase